MINLASTVHGDAVDKFVAAMQYETEVLNLLF